MTALSHVDGARGELIIAGRRVDDLAGTVDFERVARRLWAIAGAAEAPALGPLRLKAFERAVEIGPVLKGMTPVDAETFQQNRARVLQQAALRMQGLPPVDATGAPLAAPAAGAEATPAMQNGQTPQSAPIMSNTPRPSYKLSLPAPR